MNIQQYISSVSAIFNKGNATEHSYRGDLQQLLQSMLPDVDITNEPKRIECGAPDYILSRKNIPVGYIEAKDVGVELGHKAHKDQFDRYKAALDNLIITDYLEFHFYKQGELKASCYIAELSNGKIHANPQNFDQFTSLIQNFALTVTQSIKSPVKLAQMMAAKAKLIKEAIKKALDKDDEDKTQSELANLRNAFKTVLIKDIANEKFADIYAQTIAYGMFAARYHDPTLENFSREEAARLIPQSNPFLRQLFRTVAGYNLDDNDDMRILWIVEELVQIFRAADVANIMQNFGKATKQEDPVIHFYETFLAAYDPVLRKELGVWLTPQPVVNFIVRAVDDILKTKFNLPQGLGDSSKTKIKVNVQGAGKKGDTVSVEREIHKVQILDPATGTGTFLAQIIRHIYSQLFPSMKGAWPQYVRNDLIPRLNGFELIMPSYAIAHLKLDMLLTESGLTNLTNQDRLNIYLTNSLEYDDAPSLPLFNFLSSEANEANRIKRDTPVMVVMGNPPYKGISSNKSEWITDLIDDYKYTDGVHFKERKHWLNNDYVKFIRFGQYFIEKNGEGIMAYITPHSFLADPTFRAMRWNLLKAFDEIYTLDLHGHSEKKETAPDGGKDENVFDITQGVTITIFVKTGKKNPKELGKVFHSEQYGLRNNKYTFLLNNSLKTIAYKQLPAESPNFYFLPKNFANSEIYETGFQLDALFPTNVSGVVTARDPLVIDFNSSELINKINIFSDDKKSDDETRAEFYGSRKADKYLAGDSRGWKLSIAKKRIKTNNHHELIRTIAYRPFDVRRIYYSADMVDWGRVQVMKNLLDKNNHCLIFLRQIKTGDNYQHVFISNLVFESCLVSNRTSEICYGAPLYTYPDSNDLLAETTRTPNLNMQIVEAIAQGLGLTFTVEKTNPTLTLALSQQERELSPSPAGGRGVGVRENFAPIDLLDYIYAVLHSPSYRETYKEFLKIDFPRVPYPKDAATFWQLVALGSQLRQTHLLEACPATHMDTALQSMPINYPISGNNVVDKPSFEASRVNINATQYFENVPELAWNFYIGGYQPAQKWLKDRKGRALSYEDIAHYQKIIGALTSTHALMQAIDNIMLPMPSLESLASIAAGANADNYRDRADRF